MVNEAIKECPVDFCVACGFRDQEAQDKAFAQGYSKRKWPNGLHNVNPSQAVDLVPYFEGKAVWDDRGLFSVMAFHVLDVALKLKVDLEWGGDWKGFVDDPHFQLRNVVVL